MKKIILSIILILSILTFNSCNENENIVRPKINKYISEKVDINELINKELNRRNKPALENKNKNIFYAELETSLEIPKNLTKEDLEIFISENLNNFNGVLKYKINNLNTAIFEYKSGQIVSSKFPDDGYKKLAINLVSDCSFEGIRDCTKDRIMSKSKLSKIICSFTMPGCYAEEAGNCIIDNCF